MSKAGREWIIEKSLILRGLFLVSTTRHKNPCANTREGGKEHFSPKASFNACQIPLNATLSLNFVFWQIYTTSYSLRLIRNATFVQWFEIFSSELPKKM